MELDPYRPPLAEPARVDRPPSAPPARREWTWLAWLVATGLALVYAAAKALEMRRILWVGTAHRGEDYGEAFHLHAVTMFTVGAAAVFCAAAQPLFAVRTRRATVLTARLAGAGPLAWIAGTFVLADIPSWAASGYSESLRAPALGLALVAAGLAITAADYGLVILLERASMSTGRRVAALVLLSAMLLPIYLMLDRWRAMYAPDASQVLYFDPLPVEGVLHAALVGAIALAAWLAGSRERAAGVLPLIVAGVIPAALARIVTLAVHLVNPLDLHLHDTYFVLGSLHAGGSVIVLVFVASALARLERLIGRRPNRHLARAGGLALSLGLHATTLAMLQLGRLGMPRRYAAYLDAVQPMQRALGVTAAISAAGALLLVLAVIRSDSPADRGRTR